MTTIDKIIDNINNAWLTNLSNFINLAPKFVPNLRNISIQHKQDMGVAGIMATCIVETEEGPIIVKGFLYDTTKWSQETHGYVTASKI